MSKSEPAGFRRARMIGVAMASLLVLAVFTQLSIGQGAMNYDTIPYDPSLLIVDQATGAQKLDDKQVKLLAQMKGQILLGSVSYAEKQGDFDKYYTGYLLPSFSQLDNLHKLPDFRKSLLDDLRRPRSKDVRDSLMKHTMTYMKGYVLGKKKFHPAVRYNALLTIGELNADEISVANQQRFPNPLPEGLTILVDEFKKANQPDAMKLAAILGMWRHAQLDWARPEANRIPAAQRQEIAQLMLSLVNEKEAPPGRTKDGHLWLQRRALDVLGALGVVGPVDPVNVALTGLVRNPDADVALRCTAAATMGRLNTKTKPKIQPADEALHMGALLVQACNADLNRIEEYSKKVRAGTANFGDGSMPGGSFPGGMPGGSFPGGMPGGSFPGGMPGGSFPGGMPGGSAPGGMPGGSFPGGMPGGDSGFNLPGFSDDSGIPNFPDEGSGATVNVTGPKDPLVDLWRRRIKYEIMCIQMGLKGLTPLASADPQLTTLKNLNKEVANVMKATDPPANSPSLLGLHKSVKESLKELEKLTASVMPKPKPAAPAAVDSDIPDGVPAPPAAGIPAVGPADAGKAKSAAPGEAGKTNPAAPPAPGTPPAGDKNSPPGVGGPASNAKPADAGKGGAAPAAPK